jgi:predicted transcriptional regulator
MSVEQIGILKLARLKTDRHILLFLLQNETSTNEQLSEILHLSPSTVSWHIKKLVNAHILNASAVGRKIIYSIRDSELVSRVLIKYKESFLDILVDRFVEMWEL